MGVPCFRYWHGEAAEGRIGKPIKSYRTIRQKAETFTELMAWKVVRGVSENITWAMDQATDRGVALCVGFWAYLTAKRLAQTAIRRGWNDGSSSEQPWGLYPKADMEDEAGGVTDEDTQAR